MKISCMGLSLLVLNLIAVAALAGCQPIAFATSRPHSSPEMDESAGLIYRHTGALWVMGNDGEPRVVAQDEDALPSPDLRQAVHFSGTPDNTTLWITDLGTHEQRKVTTDKIVVHLFGWMDGDTVLLGTRDRSEPLEGGYGFGHLTALETSSHELQVLDPVDLCSSLPAVSPDGELIAYSTFRGARLYEWSGGPQVFDMTPFTQLPPMGDFTLTSPAWSTERQKLAWILLGQLGATDDAQAAVLILDIHAHTAEILHPFVPLGYGGLIGGPVWSPDGRWLALVAITQEGVGAGTWLISTDGSQELQVTESVLTDPFWAAEGQLVWNDEGVWILDLGSGARERVLPQGHGYAVGWATR